MGEYMKVSKNKMEADAERIEELVKTIPLFVKELEASMQQLSTCWEGPAWITFQQGVAANMEKLAKIYEYMGSYSVLMKEGARDYTRAEQDVCAYIRSVNTWI